jgi:plastocyanin
MRLVRSLLLAALPASSAVPAAVAQSLVYRPPNAGGTWVPAGGVLQFNFMHRFVVASSAGSHKVTNFPTFTFALGLGHNLALGTHYSTNSLLVLTPYRPNEFELFARWRLGAAEGERGLAVSLTPAYNAAARSVDGEIAADYTAGPFTLSAAVRGIAKPFGAAGNARAAVAGGATFRLNDYVALTGDAASFLGLDTTIAWSAGLAVVIPGSPHTFSLHASTATSNSMQGASWGFSRTAYGFEFTIPVHFSRFAPWFARRNKDRAVPFDGPMMNAAAVVTMSQYRFAADSVVIAAGQAVRWVNRDAVAHTITFDDGGVPSSGDVNKDGAFVAVFERPGVYRYHCAPHPAMKGVVVVR